RRDAVARFAAHRRLGLRRDAADANRGRPRRRIAAEDRDQSQTPRIPPDRARPRLQVRGLKIGPQGLTFTWATSCTVASAIRAIPRQMESRMQILIAAALAAVAAIQTSSLAGRVTRTDPVLVRAVVDGDTIDVALFGRVRLLGIDAPEL